MKSNYGIDRCLYGSASPGPSAATYSPGPDSATSVNLPLPHDQSSQQVRAEWMAQQARDQLRLAELARNYNAPQVKCRLSECSTYISPAEPDHEGYCALHWSNVQSWIEHHNQVRALPAS